MDTCADPSLATAFHYQHTFPGPLADFSLALPKPNIERLDTRAYAFPTRQPGTPPLYLLLNQDSLGQKFALADANGNPPSESGYATERIQAYVYPTQTCGSVSLFALFNSATTDWFYTADKRTRGQMATIGYTEEGNLGFVLPVTQGTVTPVYCAIELTFYSLVPWL